HAEYMPHDREADSERSLFTLNDASQLAPHWRLDTQLEYISDADYLDDFGARLRRIAQTYQTRRSRATWQAASSAAFLPDVDQAPLDSTITPAMRPSRKLPEFGFDFAWPNYRTGLTPELYGDFTRFEAPQRQGAFRSVLRPSASWNFAGPSWYVTPKLGVDEATYRLDAFGGASSDHVNRLTPEASLDAGLRFERRLGEGGWLTQTLEPRANYLYVPYRDQADIPIFDT